MMASSVFVLAAALLFLVASIARFMETDGVNALAYAYLFIGIANIFFSQL